MEQKNLEELYHKGELEWEEGEYTVCRGFQWTPPGCHNSCGILYYLKDGVMDHAEGDPLFPYNNGRLSARRKIAATSTLSSASAGMRRSTISPTT